jgi:hypothetical protein
LLRSGKGLNRLDKGHLEALWIEALEAPHLYVQDDRTAHAGLRPELSLILAMPARASARARGAFRPLCQACRLHRQQRVCDIEADDPLADGVK